MADYKKKDIGGPKGSTFYRDPRGKTETYLKEQSARSQRGNRFFRNFHRTMVKQHMTTYDDINFLAINQLILNDIDDGANIEAAFDALFDASWEIGAKTGNIKDLDATQEGEALDWVKRWTFIAWVLVAQYMRRTLTTAVAESSTSDNTSHLVYNWTQADWDALITQLEKVECPDFIYRFMEPFKFIIRMTESYEKEGITIPPSYFIPIVEYYHNQLSEIQALFNTAKGEMAGAMTHFRKFGIPFSKFSSAKLLGGIKEVARKDVFNDQNILAFFNICPFTYTRSGPANIRRDHAVILSGANLTTDYSNIIYMFDSKQPQPQLMAMYPMFGATYHATNNPYANILLPLATPGDTEYETNILVIKNLGTTYTIAKIDEVFYVRKLFLAFYYGVATEAPVWNGTNVTLDTKFLSYIEHPAFDENPGVFYDTGHVVGAEALNACLLAFKYMLYGEL